MHSLEVIVAQNARACGITVEQNLQEAKEGQYIRLPDRVQLCPRLQVPSAMPQETDLLKALSAPHSR